MSKSEEFHAILQRDKESFAIVPRLVSGLITPEQLRNIADVAEKFNAPVIKITSGQRIAIIGLKEDELEPAYKELGLDAASASDLCFHYMQACPGTTVCKFGVRNSLELGERLETLLNGRILPAKLKVGVSGCQFCCAESLVRDIGLIGKKNGWTLSVGGHSGNRPRVADVLATDISDDEAVALIESFLKVYAEHGKKRERTSRFLERIGSEELQRLLKEVHLS